jgi:predicted ATPase/DNA-binding XRE family transcriptional regulator
VKDPVESSFGSLLRQLRLERRLSQEELAERARMSVAAISAIERGSRQAPYRSSVDLLADGLAVEGEARARLHSLAQRRRKARALPSRVAPLPSAPNNLPLQLTSFVDRAEERANVEALLRRYRLVTLTGAGGIGKTRLALEVASEMLGMFEDGAWLVELAPLNDGALVPSAIATVLGVQEDPGRALGETINAYVKSKALLLILDNCEHVLGALAVAVDAMLRSCAQLRVLCTSIEPLGIAGEHVYPTPSLPAPARNATSALTAPEALGYPSVALFADRAQAANASFELTDAYAPIVGNLCRRLDGIALAVELAAARVGTMPVKTLAEKLDERFRLLTYGNRAGPRRQQTLQALIDWSYNLLSEPERLLFCRLAIFAGGFTVDLATALWSEGGERDALDILGSLVKKSLVQTEVAGDTPRYRLLESTRLFARERLIERDELESAAAAHAAAMLELAERLEVAYETLPDRAWKALSEPELENWRAALEWSLGSRRDVPLGQRLTAALTPLWATQAAVEGRRWIGTALETTDERTPLGLAARLELAEANIAMYLTLWKPMLAAARRAMVLFERAGDAAGAMESRIVAGRALALLGEAGESEALLSPSLEACRALKRPRLVGMALESLAMARMTAGDVAGSRPLYAQAIAVLEPIGAERSLLNATVNLAGAEFRAGDADAALRLASAALGKYRALNNPREVLVICNIAAYLVALSRLDEARDQAWKGLNMALERQMDVQVTWALQHLAAIAALRYPDGDKRAVNARRRAARILGFVDGRLAALDATRKFTEQHEYAALLAMLREGLGAEQLGTLLAEGGSWSIQEVLAEARGA